ncbi:hypothetical protein PGTUg99_035059 [Puccinia graminis f. sp. tritici]|uniref:Uncharacterized protein n=1 Tax=Puccinia graminis f. sp. tritici TaxID=56615 RepID=A0A5B0Q9J6_PUCGR|nr:hypothetical protein PGTUg99_035059 [Puccinia graminis f. sp. tritici]
MSLSLCPKGVILSIDFLPLRPLERLYAGSADKTLTAFDPKTDQVVRRHRSHGVLLNSIAVSGASGQDLLASASDDGTVPIWHKDDKNPLDSFKLGYPLTAVERSANGQPIFVGGLDNDIHCFDLRKKEVFWSLQAHTNTIAGLKLSPDGSFLLSAGFHDTVRIVITSTHDPNAPRLVQTLLGAPAGFDNQLRSPTWDASGDKVAVGATDRTFIKVSPPTSPPLGLFHPPEVPHPLLSVNELGGLPNHPEPLPKSVHLPETHPPDESLPNDAWQLQREYHKLGPHPERLTDRQERLTLVQEAIQDLLNYRKITYDLGQHWLKAFEAICLTQKDFEKHRIIHPSSLGKRTEISHATIDVGRQDVYSSPTLLLERNGWGELQIYKAALVFDAHLEGLRWARYYHPYISFCFFSVFFFIAELMAVFVTWGAALYRQSPSKSPELRPFPKEESYSGRPHSPTNQNRLKHETPALGTTEVDSSSTSENDPRSLHDPEDREHDAFFDEPPRIKTEINEDGVLVGSSRDINTDHSTSDPQGRLIHRKSSKTSRYS